ncbi:MAG: TrpB-like pyridoxal phosphate-dependent enzyme [Alphaproteobacteria bacterium]|nr:TrpB-like pyridoxal phosphate-dependent enzyme [Alphaproteobacteria bacterium]
MAATASWRPDAASPQGHNLAALRLSSHLKLPGRWANLGALRRIPDDQEIPARRRAHSQGLVQHRGRPAPGAAARAASRHDEARRSGRSGAPLPDGADHAGGFAGARDRGARARARHLPHVASHAAVPRHRTETGAGQWGSSLAFAGALFGIEITVFQVRVSYDQKPYRRALMETYGGTCVASPSTETNAGRQILAADPNSNGSLGIAISEAVEVAATNPDTKYALGSVLNHVLLHQTVIGIEAIEQMEQAGAAPDIIVGCTGGGSNFAGLTFPFIGQQLRGGKKVRVIAAEPAACPSLTRGKYAYDFGDTSHMTPLVKMHTLGSTFMPPGFHAGGLRYHGMAPLVSHLKELGLIEAEAHTQNSCFEAGILFARTEGIVPAPEATHAVRGAINAALEAKKNGTSPVILFGLCGHGHFDMQAYMDFMAGKLEDRMYDQSALDASLAQLPAIAAE